MTVSLMEELLALVGGKLLTLDKGPNVNVTRFTGYNPHILGQVSIPE